MSRIENIEYYTHANFNIPITWNAKVTDFQVLPLIFLNKPYNLQESVLYFKSELLATNQIQFYVQPSEICAWDEFLGKGDLSSQEFLTVMKSDMPSRYQLWPSQSVYKTHYRIPLDNWN